MSEIRQEWPTQGNMTDYRNAFETGLETIKNELILPGDLRFEIAAAALALGGRGSSVAMFGHPGAAKTKFAEIVYGTGSEIAIQSDDTRGTLVGYKRPTDGGFNSGSIDLDGTEAEFFFDEISHIGDNSEALNQFWNSSVIRVNGRNYDLSGMSIFGTSNFPERGERRVKQIGRALLSRFGMSVIVTAEDSVTAMIQQRTMDLRDKEDKHFGGILPPRSTRKALKKHLVGTQIVSSDAGQYVTDTSKALNSHGILRTIHKNDGRIGEGWANTAIAARFAKRQLNGERAIEPLELAMTAALSIGTLATLDLRESISLQQDLKDGALLESLEKAVFERRLVAATAFSTARENSFNSVTDEDIRKFMNKYSYAEIDDVVLAEKMDQVIVDLVQGRYGNQGGNEHVPARTNKRKWSRRGNK